SRAAARAEPRPTTGSSSLQLPLALSDCSHAFSTRLFHRGPLCFLVSCRLLDHLLRFGLRETLLQSRHKIDDFPGFDLLDHDWFGARYLGFNSLQKGFLITIGKLRGIKRCRIAFHQLRS